VDEFHILAHAYDALFFIDNGMGHSLHVVPVDQKGKLGSLYHVGGDLIACRGELVRSANRTRAVGSGRGYDHL